MSTQNFAIPQGSTVLVTGTNGYIGAHTADQLLLAGYNVRGTVRNISKAQWLQELFDEKYGPGKFELVVVPRMDVEGAYDDALKGVSGVAHIASNVSLNPDPNVVIPEVINGTLNILKSASREPSVKRFVYTSSGITTGFPVPNTPFTITPSSWNDLISQIAWAPGPYGEERKWAVYGASKTEAEKAAWKFVEEEKPTFDFSVVMPAVVFGAALVRDQSSETLKWIKSLAEGDLEAAKRDGMAPYRFVDVGDVARLHVAALINPSVKSERIFANSDPYNWSDILDVLRNAYPQISWPENIPDEPKDLSTIQTRHRSVELLKALGKDEFVTFADSVKSAAAQIL